MTFTQLQPYMMQLSVALAIFVGAFLVWRRIRRLDRKIDLLFKAAAVHARDMRKCTDLTERGFSDMRRSDNHRRVLLASLGSQMSQISSMLGEGRVSQPAAPDVANASRFERAVAELDEDGAGTHRVVPGYRLAPRREPKQATQVETPQSVQQRKAMQIDAFFRKAAAGPVLSRAQQTQVPREETQFRRAANG